ncbi:hypothetical protein, partial [Photobacterium damselae]|uniref:hypothetical protein n=1 Tax=Photobacterium damselae TaxID=38293 RepID=UPI001484DA20
DGFHNLETKSDDIRDKITRMNTSQDKLVKDLIDKKNPDSLINQVDKLDFLGVSNLNKSSEIQRDLDSGFSILNSKIDSINSSGSLTQAQLESTIQNLNSTAKNMIDDATSQVTSSIDSFFNEYENSENGFLFGDLMQLFAVN